MDDGSTGLVSVIHNKKIYVANAGDCRAVLCENGEVSSEQEEGEMGKRTVRSNYSYSLRLILSF